MTGETIYQIDKDPLREGLSRYTRKAFHMLPKLDKPRVLDVGCGSGVPTMELARLSNGQIIGLDINQPLLDRFTRKVEKAGLSDRIKTLNCSMFDMDFPDGSFDIIWAEGSIWIIGFERGLKGWRRFLKPNGFLVVHEMTWLRPDPPQEIYDYWKGYYPGMKTVPGYLEQISSCGYDLIEDFTLPEDAWWIEYYGPLEKRIKELRTKYIDNPKALVGIDKERQEIDTFKKHYGWYGSAFFVMKKR